MFKDELRDTVWNEIRQHDLRAFDGLLTPALIQQALRRCGLKLCKSPLNLVNRMWLGIACALHATQSFACVLTMTLKLLEDQQHFAQSNVGKAQKKGRAKKGGRRKKHSPRISDPTQVSEEAFAKARQRMPPAFWVQLIVLLGEYFETKHSQRLKFRGFRVLAIDGTRLRVPECEALRAHYGTARNKTGNHNPQAHLVLLQFPLVRMPYRYEVSPVSVGEVTLALRLVAALRPGDLVLLDAGYWSYGLLWAIQQRGAYFAIRQRKDIRIKTVRKLAEKDLLVRWTPKDSRGKWRKQQLPASIDLRVVKYRVPGFSPQAVVTNMLCPKRLTRDDWTRLATSSKDVSRKLVPGLYHRRWEIETTYRELKVEQGLDRHLRSHTPASIEYEIAGHLVLYLLVRWLIVEAAVKHGIDPSRLSFVHALRELELIRVALLAANPQWAVLLVERLLDRIAEHDVPHRPGRQYPRNRKGKQAKGKQSRKSKTRKKG